VPSRLLASASVLPQAAGDASPALTVGEPPTSSPRSRDVLGDAEVPPFPCLDATMPLEGAVDATPDGTSSLAAPQLDLGQQAQAQDWDDTGDMARMPPGDAEETLAEMPAPTQPEARGGGATGVPAGLEWRAKGRDMRAAHPPGLAAHAGLAWATRRSGRKRPQTRPQQPEVDPPPAPMPTPAPSESETVVADPGPVGPAWPAERSRHGLGLQHQDRGSSQRSCAHRGSHGEHDQHARPRPPVCPGVCPGDNPPRALDHALLGSRTLAPLGLPANPTSARAPPCRAVVRGRAREALPAYNCDQCKRFYEAAAPHLAGKLCQDCGRHRGAHEPPATPDGLWDPSMQDSETQPPGPSTPSGTPASPLARRLQDPNPGGANGAPQLPGSGHDSLAQPASDQPEVDTFSFSFEGDKDLDEDRGGPSLLPEPPGTFPAASPSLPATAALQ